jgi:hypothetical protein
MKTFNQIQEAIKGTFHTKKAITELKDDLKSLYKRNEIQKIILNTMHNDEAPAALRNQADQDYWNLPHGAHQLRKKHITMIERYSADLAKEAEQVMNIWPLFKGIEVTKKVKKVETKAINDSDRAAMKSSNQALFMGSCQCCGKLQKLPQGVLSKHGYTVDWGTFWGVCQGASHLPYEESCDLIESFIKRAEEAKVAMLEDIESLKTETETFFMYVYADRKSSWKVFNKSDVITEKKGDFEFHYVMTKEGEKRTNRNSSQLGSYSCSTIEDCIKYENSKRIEFVLKQIEEVEEYIAWQQKRVADWELKPLIPVK